MNVERDTLKLLNSTIFFKNLCLNSKYIKYLGLFFKIYGRYVKVNIKFLIRVSFIKSNEVLFGTLKILCKSLNSDIAAGFAKK